MAERFKTSITFEVVWDYPDGRPRNLGDIAHVDLRLTSTIDGYLPPGVSEQSVLDEMHAGFDRALGRPILHLEQSTERRN